MVPGRQVHVSSVYMAPAPFRGLGAPFGLTQPQASTIAADHHPTPCYAVLKRRALDLLFQPGPGRIVAGDQPYRFGVVFQKWRSTEIDVKLGLC
jgi:hypothetical protein